MDTNIDTKKVQTYYFTFGCGTLYKNKYAKFVGTWEGAREEMVENYGHEWCLQYDEEHFKDMPKKYGLSEIEDNKNAGLEYVCYNYLMEELKEFLGNEYVEELAEKIYKKVAEDVRVSSGFGTDEGYCDYDIKLAIGRVLLNAVDKD